MDENLENLILATFEKALERIRIDYPNANPTYKRESFVVGAQEMAMTFFRDLAFEEKFVVAGRIDEIRNRIFPVEAK